MDLKLNAKTVFISGSTAGIGFATAKALLQEGAKVWINGRDEEGVSQSLQKLRTLFPQANIQGLATDFSKPADIESLFQQISEVDILINNVGIYASKSFFDTTDEDWLKQMDVNVMSGVRLSRHYLPKMLKKNWGRIIFISSECASLVPEDLIAYSTTKAALLAISRGLAQLTKGTHVTVNSLIPGSTLTEGAERFLSNLAQEKNQSIEETEAEFFRDIRTSSLIQRFASVEEVANTITYLASPLASATNGAAIKVDGGSMGGLI